MQPLTIWSFSMYIYHKWSTVQTISINFSPKCLPSYVFHCVSFLYFTGVLSQGSWLLLNELEDPELQELASKLPSTILHSRADSTIKKYLGAFRRWKAWAISHNLIPVPAKPHEVALYLQHLAEESGSKSAVEEACNALAWIHSTAGLSSPSSHPFVKATLEGLQRTLAKPVVKKEPVTLEMLEAMVEDANRSGSLSDLRLVTACLLSFAGFLRFDEMINLRPCDLSFTQEMLTIHLVRSKTDQLRQGSEVLVARTNNSTCPVAMLERYMQSTSMAPHDQRFLFRPIQSTRKGEFLRDTGKISYSCLRDLFRKKLSDLGFPPNEFGLHSLRAGGATAAANAKVPDRMFKRHGRWKSENAKDGYVKDDVKSRLEVSRSLGLYLGITNSLLW